MFPLYLFLAASPEPVELHWSSPRGCPDEDAIRNKLAQSLAGTPAANSSFVAEARVTRVGKQFTLDLRLHNETYDQSVQYKRRACAALGDMAVLYIESVFPGFRPEPDPAPAAAPEPVAAPPQPAKPKPRLGGSLRVGGVGGGMHTGFADGLVALGGPSLHLGLRGRRWRVEAGSHYLMSAKQGVAFTPVDDNKTFIAWQLVGGQASACGAAVARSAAELHLCGGLEIGAVLGQPEHSDITLASKRASAVWIGLQAGPMVTVRLHRALHLWASATPALAYIGKLVIDVANTPRHATHLWWQLRAALGIEVRWGA